MEVAYIYGVRWIIIKCYLSSIILMLGKVWGVWVWPVENVGVHCENNWEEAVSRGNLGQHVWGARGHNVSEAANN